MDLGKLAKLGMAIASGGSTAAIGGAVLAMGKGPGSKIAGAVSDMSSKSASAPATPDPATSPLPQEMSIGEKPSYMDPENMMDDSNPMARRLNKYKARV